MASISLVRVAGQSAGFTSWREASQEIASRDLADVTSFRKAARLSESTGMDQSGVRG